MPFPTDWAYKKKVAISGSTGAGTNYQVLLKVGESSGSTGVDFHVEGHSALFPSGKNDSGDLRFTASDGTTLLDFWVEKVEGTSPNRVAHCWVKVLDNLDTSKDIYCYYGNSAATNVSNGVNTFVFFDNFNAYADGDLNGQGGWTGHTNFDVQGTNVSEGAKAIVNNHPEANAGQNVTHLVSFPASFEIRAILMRPAGGTLGTAAAYLGVLNATDGSLSEMTLWIESNGTKYLRLQAASPVNDGNWSDGVWVKGIFQIRSDYYSRCFVEGATPTAFVAPYQPGPPTKIYLGAYFQNNPGYWDEIIIRKWIDPEPAFSSAGAEETTIILGSAVLSGIGNLTATGKLFLRGITTLSGTGNLSALGGLILKGSALLSGTGSLSAIGNVYKLGQAILSGIGNLTAKGVGIFRGRATLSGIGNLSALGRLILRSSALLSGIGSLTAQGIKIVLGKVSILGQGLLSAKGTMIYIGKALLSGIGNLNAIGKLKIGYFNKYTKQGDVYYNKYL